MIKILSLIIMICTSIYAITPESSMTEANHKPDTQPELTKPQDTMDTVIAQLKNSQNSPPSPRLRTPEIKLINFGIVTPANDPYLKSNEVFHILHEIGVMTAIPSDAKNQKLEPFSNDISTPYGTITIRSGGFFSKVIYDIKITKTYATGNDTHFIIKEIGWGQIKEGESIKRRKQPTPVKEIQDLNLVKQELGNIFKDFNKDNPLFPEIALDTTSCYYVDSSENKHYITIFSAVHGTEAAQIIDTNLQTQATMKRIGRALGEFHYKLANPEQQNNIMNFQYFRTITHGDFHLSNVFVSDNNISFIDNASISNSIRTPQSPLIDIIRLYSKQLYLDHMIIHNFTFKTIKDSFQAFIEGYVEAYPEDSRTLIKDTIQSALDALDSEVKLNAEEFIQNGSFPNVVLQFPKNFGFEWALANIRSQIKRLVTAKIQLRSIQDNLGLPADIFPKPEIAKPSGFGFIDPSAKQPKQSSLSGYENEPPKSIKLPDGYVD